ncbi:glycosyltransferase family 4 protein [Saccharicrinis sp. 156]|uniref:glycosyltransferase family 4 protein n=1 Tax=Saccharicrinis sp. 156 TaxID=3417574 RepID=UPI003D34BE5E
MIKIFHLITSVQLGGAEVVAYNIIEECTRLYPEKYDFTIVELFSSRNIFAANKKKELKEKNIKIISLSKLSKRKSLIFSPFKLYALVKKEKPKVIHAHTDLPDFVLSVALRILGKHKSKSLNVVRSIHNTELWPTYKGIGKLVEKVYTNDYVIGVSDAALLAYKKSRGELGLGESPHQNTIYNGCAVPKNSALGLNLSSDKINIAICGRLEQQKGIDFLISFFKKNNINLKNTFCFYFIGDGTYKSQVEQLANLESNIKLYPPIIGIANKIHAFDYVLMPSRFEGLVLMSIEASLAKIPVIASKVDGLKDTLPNDWPLFFTSEDENSLLELLYDIKGKRIEREELKEKAFSFASAKFSVTQMALAYADVYDSFHSRIL